MEQSSSTPRELTLDEAMACAVECLKNGQMDEAEVICRKILEVAPDHPDALHLSGSSGASSRLLAISAIASSRRPRLYASMPE